MSRSFTTISSSLNTASSDAKRSLNIKDIIRIIFRGITVVTRRPKLNKVTQISFKGCFRDVSPYVDMTDGLIAARYNHAYEADNNSTKSHQAIGNAGLERELTLFTSNALFRRGVVMMGDDFIKCIPVTKKLGQYPINVDICYKEGRNVRIENSNVLCGVTATCAILKQSIFPQLIVVDVAPDEELFLTEHAKQSDIYARGEVFLFHGTYHLKDVDVYERTDYGIVCLFDRSPSFSTNQICRISYGGITLVCEVLCSMKTNEEGKTVCSVLPLTLITILNISGVQLVGGIMPSKDKEILISSDGKPHRAAIDVSRQLKLINPYTGLLSNYSHDGYTIHDGRAIFTKNDSEILVHPHNANVGRNYSGDPFLLPYTNISKNDVYESISAIMVRMLEYLQPGIKICNEDIDELTTVVGSLYLDARYFIGNNNSIYKIVARWPDGESNSMARVGTGTVHWMLVMFISLFSGEKCLPPVTATIHNSFHTFGSKGPVVNASTTFLPPRIMPLGTSSHQDFNAVHVFIHDVSADEFVTTNILDVVAEKEESDEDHLYTLNVTAERRVFEFCVVRHGGRMFGRVGGILNFNSIAELKDLLSPSNLVFFLTTINQYARVVNGPVSLPVITLSQCHLLYFSHMVNKTEIRRETDNSLIRIEPLSIDGFNTTSAIGWFLKRYVPDLFPKFVDNITTGYSICTALHKPYNLRISDELSYDPGSIIAGMAKLKSKVPLFCLTSTHAICFFHDPRDNGYRAIVSLSCRESTLANDHSTVTLETESGKVIVSCCDNGLVGTPLLYASTSAALKVGNAEKFFSFR